MNRIIFINRYGFKSQIDVENIEYWIKHIENCGGKIISTEQLKPRKHKPDYKLLKEIF